MNNNIPDPNSSSFHPSFATVALLLILGLWGCLLIYSSRALGSSPYYFANRQILWLFLGIPAYLLTAFIPFPVYKVFSRFLFYLILFLMFLLLPFGHEINGMRGWFRLGDFLLLQPSEFMKFAFVLYLCVLAHGEYRNERQRFLRMLFVTAMPCILLLFQPDLGTALIFFSGFLLTYWISGGALKYVVSAILMFLTTALGFILCNAYAFDRILAYWNPSVASNRSSWHIRQFQYALAQGGMYGSELGGAVWANAYLPLPHSDSLFATIVESSGAIGGWIVIFGFLILAFAFLRMSRGDSLDLTARDFIFAGGILYVVQAFLHISVNVVLLPPTGVTLPFLSYGGSSLFSIMIALGILSSASRCNIAENGKSIQMEKEKNDV